MELLEHIKAKFTHIFDRYKEWNQTKSNIHEHRRLSSFAKVVTRIGFFAKSILYATIGVIAILAAVQNERDPEGPQSVIEDLRSTFGEVVVFLFTIGLFCYSGFAVLYSIFDFDQIGHHGAGNKLKRFGRLFSAGFYAFIGATGVQIVINVRSDSDISSQLLKSMFSHWAGKAFLCFLGIVLLSVSCVYFVYIWKPKKFRMELASERMSPHLFTFCTIIARIGALGRSLFFASFGAVLIMSVKDVNEGHERDLTVLGFEGVLTRIAHSSPPFLFVVAVLLIFYAVWALILCIFRRIPAHATERDSFNALGTRRRVKQLHAEVNLIQLKNFSEPNREHAITIIDPEEPAVVVPRANLNAEEGKSSVPLDVTRKADEPAIEGTARL